MSRPIVRVVALVALTQLALACATNPVTGKRELSLMSEAEELQIGEQQYVPTRQMQGGDYLLEPELTRYVQGVGNRLAAVSDRALPYEFQVLNSSVPNAWALPGGKIAINRGLMIELENEAQLAAVLGHEIVHAAAKHTARAVSRQQLLGAAVLATTVGVAVAGDERYAGLTAVAGGLGAQLVTHKYGRDAELESDLYGTQYMKAAGYDPQAAVELQEVFVRLSGGRNSDWLSGLFSTHPPSQERVVQNQRTVERLGAGGEVGRDRYQRMIAGVKARLPAYEAFDAGRAALAEKNFDEARSKALAAISMEPREARFHELLGDVALLQDQKQQAIAYYDKAIALDGGTFFRPLVLRGLTKKDLGDRAGSRADLERSMQLLPTEAAQQALTELSGG